MTSMDEARAAGWYPDPLNSAQTRWWDGREWTQLSHAVTANTAAIGDVPDAATSAGSFGAPTSGWYPDPGNPHFQRYWDGTAWTPNVAPGATQFTAGTTVIVNNQAPKSVGVAFLLTLLFGPLGVFYSSITGGVVMVLVSFFGGILFGLVTFGFGLVVWVPMVWVASIIWGCLAVSSSGHTTVISR